MTDPFRTSAPSGAPEGPGRHLALDLGDRAVLVTGGRGALGQSIVDTLRAHRAEVVAVDLAASVPPGLGAERGPGVLHDLQADVTAGEEVERVFDEAEERLARMPDVVLCHAGVVGTHALREYPVEEFDALMGVNLRGSFLVARTAARRWVEQRVAGHLIFTASWVHAVSWPDIGPYSASKAAVVQLSRSFAAELAPFGIRANAVAPGIVAAGMAQQQWDDDPAYRERAARAVPLGRLQTTQSVADAFLFLCSDLASYVTGATLTVDGGASLYPAS